MIDRQIFDHHTSIELKKGFEKAVRNTERGILQELENIILTENIDLATVKAIANDAARLWVDCSLLWCRVFVSMSRSNKRPSRLHYQSASGVRELVIQPRLDRIGNSNGQDLDVKVVVSGCEGQFNDIELD